MTGIMRQIMTGEATQAQIGGFLMALRMKGETIEEITAAAQVMRELATPVQVNLPNLIDTCGTGGDGSKTFNISTACALVAAAGGAHVAKHGNRSMSSKSGSADVLEAAGVKLDLNPTQIAQCIEKAGVGFMFAPAHHGAMKHAIGPRKELGVRTIFNLLGPMTNPAGAKRQVIGVFAQEWVKPIADVLKMLGSEHVMVVHSEDHLDEISIAAPTSVAELKNGQVSEYTINPGEFSCQHADLSALVVDDAEASLAMIRSVLGGQAGPALDIVKLNSGAALYVAGLADSLAAAVEKAGGLIADGSASKTLDSLAAVSQEF
ncbi:MAG: anthranilate phosphoribosyltransferase [Pseudomonadota bacterium]